MNRTEPLACMMDAIPAEERATHRALIVQLFEEAALERLKTPSGYAFRFEPDELPSIARFIDSERLCCPFLEITFTVPPSGGPIWLRFAGPGGTREFLDAELYR